MDCKLQACGGANVAPLTARGRRSALAGAVALATAALAGGCATTSGAPGTGGTAVAARPGIVQGNLTSAVKREPYTAEQMADSTFRRWLAQCEAARKDGACRERWVATDRRRSFALAADQQVIAQFDAANFSTGGYYNYACQFVDPAGSVILTMQDTGSIPADMPRNHSVTDSCIMAIGSETATGKWAVRYLVNGETMSVLRFDVVEAGGPAI